MPAKAKRIRRTPEEARRLILDAAEARMGVGGPAALRLQEVAEAAGVSHPTILHHFGSREGLVLALNRRAVESLKTQLLATMGPDRDGQDGIALTFAAYRNGLAQRLMWLLHSAIDMPPPQGLTMFEDIVQALHATRLRFAKPDARIDIEDSRAIVHLVTISAFGDALIGARLRRTSGMKEKTASEKFERWLSALIENHIIGQGSTGEEHT